MSVRQERSKSIARAVVEAQRVSKVLTPGLVAELDLTMRQAFTDAQGKVPVESRSLKNSGRSGGEVRDGGDTWVGYMAWGGASAPQDVDYAIYAMANGGGSDWLRDSPLYDAAFEAVIDAHLRGHVR